MFVQYCISGQTLYVLVFYSSWLQANSYEIIHYEILYSQVEMYIDSCGQMCSRYISSYSVVSMHTTTIRSTQMSVQTAPRRPQCGVVQSDLSSLKYLKALAVAMTTLICQLLLTDFFKYIMQSHCFSDD